MNRKKKINSIFTKRMKKKNSKLHTSNKPKYISKEERAKLEAEAALEEASTVTAVNNATTESAEQKAD